jgi:hypothetical protein
MKKILFFTVAFCLVATSAAFAKDKAGSITLGATMSKDIEIGYVMSNNARIMAGFGFGSQDVGDESATSFNIGAAYKHPLVGGDRADFFALVGLDFGSQDVPAAGGLDSETSFGVLGGFCFEIYFGDTFSVGAGHGIRFASVSPPGDNVDSSTSFGTFSEGLTEMSFTYYFEKK